MDRERRAAARAFAADPLNPDLALALVRAHQRDGTPVPGWVAAVCVHPARTLRFPDPVQVELHPPGPNPELPAIWNGQGPWWHVLAAGQPLTVPAHRAWFANPLKELAPTCEALAELPGPVGLQTFVPGWGPQLGTIPQLEWLCLLHRAAATPELRRVLPHVGGRLRRLLIRKAPGLGRRGLSALTACPHLGSLHLAGLSRLRDDDLDVLGELPELAELIVDESGSLQGDGLTALRDLPHLRRLTLRRCRRLESRSLPELPQLRALGLPRAQSPDYATLARQTGLRELSCGGTGVGLAQLAALPLERVELGDVSAAGLRELCGHPGLRAVTLHVWRRPVEDQLDALSRLPRLQHLRLLGGPTRHQLGPGAGAVLAQLTGLETLELEPTLPADSLPGLLSLPGLRRLQLHQVADPLPTPRRRSDLERLELRTWPGFSGADLAALVGALPQLRRLQLPRGHRLARGDLARLHALAQLEDLDLPGGALPPSALVELADHPRLARVRAVGDGFDPAAAAPLGRLPRLELAEVIERRDRRRTVLRPDGSTAAG